jgi:hypothetical protein
MCASNGTIGAVAMTCSVTKRTTTTTTTTTTRRKKMSEPAIYCCIMHHSHLKKINASFAKYVSYNKELVNVTMLTDEADLAAPTTRNNISPEALQHVKNGTLCEQYLSKIYKKVKYALQITGTAHSLFYNVTTKLGHNELIRMKASQVHKMDRDKPSDNGTEYYGLFNNRINFKTEEVDNWWNKKGHKHEKYTIDKDYKKNIKGIINTHLRSIEEIKDRFYTINNILLKIRNLKI